MATALSDIQDVFNTVHAARIADQIRKDVFLLNVFNTRRVTDQNKACLWTVKLDGRDNARPDDGSDVNFTTDFATTNKRLQATVPWSRYTAFAQTDGLAEAIADLGATDHFANATSLMGEELDDAIDDLTLKVSTHLYTGDSGASPAEVGGLDEICATGTYAGINPASSGNSKWAAIDATGSLAALTRRMLRDDLIEPYRTASGRDPELITCSSTMFNALVDSIEDGASYQEVKSLQLSGRGDQVDLSLITGVRALEVEGIPVVQDRHCPANSFYAIHTNGVEIEHIPGARLPNVAGVVDALSRLTGKGVAPELVQEMFRQGQDRLTPWMKHMGRHGDSERFMVGLYFQLKPRFRNRFGRLVLS